jgi:hypothetical protein
VQQPEGKEHQEKAETRCAEEQHRQELLRLREEQHAQGDNQVNDKNKDEGRYSFVHVDAISGSNIEKYFKTGGYPPKKPGQRG